MAECPACTSAATEPHYEFRANCRGCCARSIARSPQAFEARKAGRQTHGYRSLLEQVGRLVEPPVSHDEVRDAYASDALHRTEAPC